MVEKEAVREKEAEVPSKTHYDDNMHRHNEQNVLAKKGKKLIKAKEVPFEINRQGIVRFYCAQGFKELTNDDWRLFCHEIRQHSGQHRHQGGIYLFVIKGKGYSVVDGKRYDWSAGDLICLPIKKGGVVHQHFNLDGKPSRWVAFRNDHSNCIGQFMEQKEAFAMWNDKEKSEPGTVNN